MVPVCHIWISIKYQSISTGNIPVHYMVDVMCYNAQFSIGCLNCVMNFICPIPHVLRKRISTSMSVSMSMKTDMI